MRAHVRLLAGLPAGAVAVGEAGRLRLGAIAALTARLLHPCLLLCGCLHLRCHVRRLRLRQDLQGLHAGRSLDQMPVQIR